MKINWFSKPKTARIGGLSIGTAVLLIFFQNCGKSGFVSVDPLTEITELGSTTADSEGAPTQPTLPALPGQKLLYIAKSGSGIVTSNPSGIDCGADCSENFESSVAVTLMATPALGSVFKGWSGACSGVSLSCTVSMSTIRNVNVVFESATKIDSIDLIINAMPANSWKSLDATLMKNVCPSPYSSYACEAVVSAWGGGAYDDKRERMIVIGGGHGDSWYNNVFAFDLATLQWSRLSEMPEGAGKTPPPGWSDIRIETCGFYPKGVLNIPDGLMTPGKNYLDQDKCFQEPILSQLDLQQPRSTHTYNRVFHDRVNDRYCYIALGTYPSAQTATTVVSCFSPVTGLWSRIADRPSNVAGRGQTAVDSKGHIWAITDASGLIGEYDPYANIWKTYGYLNANAGGGTDIDRNRNHLYVLYQLNTGEYSTRRFDLSSAASLTAKPPYSEITTTGEAPKSLGPRPGFVYADGKDLFYTWGGGKDIYTLDPVSGVWKHLVGTGDNPGEQTKWGTYGRFRYSQKRGVFVLVNSTTQNVFIYKP